MPSNTPRCLIHTFPALRYRDCSPSVTQTTQCQTNLKNQVAVVNSRTNVRIVDRFWIRRSGIPAVATLTKQASTGSTSFATNSVRRDGVLIDKERRTTSANGVEPTDRITVSG